PLPALTVPRERLGSEPFAVSPFDPERRGEMREDDVVKLRDHRAASSRPLEDELVGPLVDRIVSHLNENRIRFVENRMNRSIGEVDDSRAAPANAFVRLVARRSVDDDRQLAPPRE